MLIHNKNDEYINNLCLFFMNHIAKCNMMHYFEINITNNLIEDANKFLDRNKLEFDNNYAGITILPHNKKDKIQILISEDSCSPDIILHELSHMYDFVLFSNRFCGGKLHNIQKHKYYLTVVYWSEFHAKQIDIPYLHMLLDIYNGVQQEKLLFDFKNNIKTFFYSEYNKKFLNKKNPTIKDTMWYLGELFVCNLYDENNTYKIPHEIVENHKLEIIKLYELVAKYSTFEAFANNIEDFHNYFH